jgi:hypothetical protein
MPISHEDVEAKHLAASSPSAEAVAAFPYTPGAATRGIYVGGAGSLTVTMERNGTGIVFSGIPAGTVLPIRVRSITAGTATLVVALF